jgi:hypothetical protein
MRRLVWLGVVLAVLWSGWWFFAAQAIENGVSGWLADRRSEGWQADVAQTRVSGFPVSFDATLTDPALADPQTGVAFTTSALQFSAPAWSPTTVSVYIPSDELVLSTPIARYKATAKAAEARLRLRAGTSAEVSELALQSGSWAISGPWGILLGAAGIEMRMLQDAENHTLYAFNIDAPAFQPGDVPRRALRLPADWPLAFDNLALDMSVRFDKPFDRRTIEEARPQPRRIDLRVAEAAWGKLLIRFAAELDVSDAGIPTGDVAVQARNWQSILEIAENAGVLPGAVRPQLENILAALARGSGNPDAIDVTLALRNGTIFMGFIPLGPAPRLVIR